MRRIALSAIVVCLLSSFLVACGNSTQPAVRAVEDYINALVSKDENRLKALACADWEPNALTELDSLQSVQTKLEGLACSVSGKDGSTTLVTCQGKIIATYNNENQELDLSARTYQVVQQGGDYLMCGYR